MATKEVKDLGESSADHRNHSIYDSEDYYVISRTACLSILGLGAFLVAAGGPALAQGAPPGVYSLVSVPSGMELHAPDGKVVLEYVTVRPDNIGLTAPSAAYFDPVNTPSGERVTNVAPNDHPHHRGIFFGFMNSEFHIPSDYSNAAPTHPVKGFTVERGDFWAWGAYAPREGRVIQNRSVKLIERRCGSRPDRDSQRLVD